jgi:ABC-type transporter Mla MlaB component
VAAPEDSATPSRARPASPWPRERTTIALRLAGSIARADIPALCARARTLMDSGDGDPLICDVGAVAEPDVVTIDALARLQLTARRVGRQIGLSHASRELQELLDFVGLSGVVPLNAGSRIEARRQTEEREIRGGVQEERDPADPTA